MKSRNTLLAGAALALTLASGMAHANTVITFDDQAEGSVITNQYQSQDLLVGGPGTATILSVPDYNYSGYPPASGANVIYESSGGGEIDFTPTSGTWSLFGFYATNGNGSLTATAYAGATVVGSFSVPNNYGSTTYQQLTAPGITRVAVQGLSDYYTLDNVTFNSAGGVPEPASWAMMILGFLGLGGVLRAHRKSDRKLRALETATA